MRKVGLRDGRMDEVVAGSLVGYHEGTADGLFEGDSDGVKLDTSRVGVVVVGLMVGVVEGLKDGVDVGSQVGKSSEGIEVDADVGAKEGT